MSVIILEEVDGPANPQNAVSLSDPVRKGLLETIGQTPLVRIGSLSDATGCEILAKAEFLNPGGSPKDRVAAQIVTEAMSRGDLSRGGTVAEGTSGSTGISLAMVAQAVGCHSYVSLPDDAAEEKKQLLHALGAHVESVRPVSITHKDHFVNKARRRATEGSTNSQAEPVSILLRAATEGCIFANQFENMANFRAHYLGTAPELWQQTKGRLDAFIAAAGTGGTIAGVSRYLKEKDSSIRIYLVDPPGSSLHNKVARGVLYTRQEAEGHRLRNPDDTVMEGIGLNRLTNNFKEARIDASFQATDLEAVEMARFVLRNDGLFLGSSSAMNLVGAVKAAWELGKGHTVVTVLCDSGARHLSKFWNPQVLQKRGIMPDKVSDDLSFIAKDASSVAAGL
ncbi:hypothetical protein CYMTET_41298 [Cymbomonas tetramitiformis]|uniref:cysteine synthase n=1 Tax=Cymbomonas tetramitiformis TaxID=36881 RepID=A0AAE0C6F0_9CHLO|nr:hypothetical protein CYMTET_41298 [Cymbomonas tetramitiformis]